MESIREIFQNTEDQFSLDSKHKIDINYDKEKETLFISSDLSSLDRETLLMGWTSKKDDDDTIGKYGEGYKIALSVLLRIGKNVTIKNNFYNEIWRPFLYKDPKYNKVEVLNIEIEKTYFKKKEKAPLLWEIQGIKEEEWLLVKERYLRILDKGETFEYSKSEVLFDEKFKGSIFVNGIFVNKDEKNLLFGYNFKSSDLILDRDRGTIADFDLSRLSSKLLKTYINENGSRSEDILHALSSKTRYRDLVYLFDKIFDERFSFSESYDNYFNIGSKFYIKEMNEINNNKFKSYPIVSQSEKQIYEETYPDINTTFVSEKAAFAIKNDPQYKDVQTFYENFYQDRVVEKDNNPTQVLRNFRNRNIDNLSFSVMKELNDIISQSKEWTLKSIDNEPDSNSFKINNKQIEEKQLDIFYEQEKKYQIDKKNNDLKNKDLIDDIPF